MSLIPDGGANAGNSNGGANPNAAGANPAGAAGADGSGAAGAGAAAVTQTGDWYYADNIKGDGTRPDWFKGDKYKTVTDQAKAYADAEKRLGGFKGAPEEYDLTIEGEVKFSKEDPLVAEFAAKAREAGVSQEFFSELLNTYAHALTANLPDPDAEMKKIGVNAEQDLEILAQWAGGILSPDEFGIFKGMINTADAFKVFDKLRNAGTGADIAPPQGNTPHETKDQVLALISDPRYDSDEQFRADVRARLSRAMAREGVKK